MSSFIYAASSASAYSFLRFTAFSLRSQFAPRSESPNRTLANSLPGTFAPGPFRSLAYSLLALSFPGTLLPQAKWPWNFRSVIDHDVDTRYSNCTSPIFGPYLLRPNGCVDQDATWYGGRPRPRGLCVRLKTAKKHPKCTETHLFSSKIKKKISGEGHSPSSDASPQPTSLGAKGAFGASILRHLGCPPDLLTLPPPFPHTFRRLCPQRKSHETRVPGSESSRERNGQGTKGPGSISARVLLADSLRGANWPGSEKARYLFLMGCLITMQP